MLVTLISQCEKKAHQRTRSVIDAFAERIGTNTWQTIITQQGLEALHTELRKTASKSTAVACHWNRSRTRTELLWIVGKKQEFNASGNVPVNETEEEIGKFMEKEKWKYLPIIKGLSKLAGLFHDWGKCNKFFQSKLLKKALISDPHRHEWLSVLFLKTLYTRHPEGEDWLKQLELGVIDEKKIRGKLFKTAKDNPFKGVHSDCLKLVLWLILSHHRMPLLQSDQYKGTSRENLDALLESLNATWGYESNHLDITEKDFKKCYTYTSELISSSPNWLSSVTQCARELRGHMHLIQEAMENGAYRAILHHARLSLMLADHNYSSVDENSDKWVSNLSLYANTSASKELNQHLDNHLFHVAEQSQAIASQLPTIEDHLAGLPSEKILTPSPDKYEWQDLAVKKVSAIATEHQNAGFFAINIASTGCGKTIANAKIIAAAGKNDPQGIRFTVALGLRTLTLQTGDEYTSRLNLNNQELATIIGSSAVQKLHTLSQFEKDNEKAGSESKSDLFSDEVIFTGEFDKDKFRTVLESQKHQKMLAAPALVCTIDHLMGATETMRGGRYILPSLRILSSDIVIDEIDDFTGSDEIAIGRLIFLAGMLGKRVLLSSATIPPSMAEGYYHSYQQGWNIFSQTHSDTSSMINCMWVDEFKKPRVKQVHSLEEYKKHHERFTTKRADELTKAPAKRKCNLVETPLNHQSDSAETTYFDTIIKEVRQKHLDHHTPSYSPSVSISLGVIRVATIKTAVALTQYMLNCALDPDLEIRVMTYHSRQTLLLRHEQEKYLDSILKRKNDDNELSKNSIIKQHLESVSADTKHVAFIVVATPVEEVGRDHDFDWAIIEPSSYRSLIQMAGRVARHRDITPGDPNIALLEYNLNAYRDGDKTGTIYFRRPGYEVRAFCLNSHSLKQTTNLSELEERLDSTPRIINNAEDDSLIGIEHQSIAHRLCNYDLTSPDSLSGYITAPWWLTAMPQRYHPFRKSAKSIILCLIYDPESQECYFSERLKGKFTKTSEGKLANHETLLKITHSETESSFPERLWLSRNYITSLKDMATKEGSAASFLSEIYGEISITLYENNHATYLYNDQLGLQIKQ